MATSIKQTPAEQQRVLARAIELMREDTQLGRLQALKRAQDVLPANRRRKKFESLQGLDWAIFPPDVLAVRQKYIKAQDRLLARSAKPPADLSKSVSLTLQGDPPAKVAAPTPPVEPLTLEADADQVRANRRAGLAKAHASLIANGKVQLRKVEQEAIAREGARLFIENPNLTLVAAFRACAHIITDDPRKQQWIANAEAAPTTWFKREVDKVLPSVKRQLDRERASEERKRQEDELAAVEAQIESQKEAEREAELQANAQALQSAQDHPGQTEDEAVAVRSASKPTASEPLGAALGVVAGALRTSAVDFLAGVLLDALRKVVNEAPAILRSAVASPALAQSSISMQSSPSRIQSAEATPKPAVLVVGMVGDVIQDKLTNDFGRWLDLRYVKRDASKEEMKAKAVGCDFAVVAVDRVDSSRQESLKSRVRSFIGVDSPNRVSEQLALLAAQSRATQQMAIMNGTVAHH